MNKEDLAFIGCRLLALYWAVMALYSVSSFATSWVAWRANAVDFPSETAGIVYFSLAPLALCVFAALLLCFGAVWIGPFLIPKAHAPSEDGAITRFEAQSIVFATVGVLILLSSLPEMGGVLYAINLLKELDSHAEISLETKAQVFELTIRLLLSVLLWFGAKGLSELLTRLRGVGLK